MKFILSIFEANAAIKKIYNLPDSAVISIEGLVPSPVTATSASPVKEVPVLPRSVMRTIGFIDANVFNNKIECIKQYRSLTGLGLKEAKESVENWIDVRAFIMKTGQLGIYFNGRVQGIR